MRPGPLGRVFERFTDPGPDSAPHHSNIDMAYGFLSIQFCATYFAFSTHPSFVENGWAEWKFFENIFRPSIVMMLKSHVKTPGLESSTAILI